MINLNTRIYITVHYDCKYKHIACRGIFRSQATEKQLSGEVRELSSPNRCQICEAAARQAERAERKMGGRL